MHKQSQYSTIKISEALLKEIIESLHGVKDYGSVEIYIQNGVVTQITVRNIRKTNGNNGATKHVFGK